MHKYIVVVLIFFLSSSTMVFADESIYKKLDLKEAILIALENNNEIRALKKTLSVSERNIGIERSDLLPHISVGEDFTSTNNPADVLVLKMNQTRVTARDLELSTINKPPNITNFLTYGLLEQVIFDKKVWTELKITQKQYSSNGHIYLREEEELIKDVAQAYIQIIMSEDTIKMANQSLTDKKEQFLIAQKKNEKNKGLYSDILEAETQVAQAEQKIVSVNRSYNVAKRALGLKLGSKESIEISGSLPVLVINPMDYYKTYSVYRNDIKAMEVNYENSKNGIKLAQAGWYPTLTANVSYNLYSSEFPCGAQGNNYIFGAFFKWNAFNGNKRHYEILKAKDKSQEVKEYLENLKKTVDFKVFEAYAKVEESKENFVIAKTALKVAEEGKNLVVKKWLDSNLKFTDVEQAQINLDKARENFVKSQNDLKSQLINLYFESGTIKTDLNL